MADSRTDFENSSPALLLERLMRYQVLRGPGSGREDLGQVVLDPALAVNAVAQEAAYRGGLEWVRHLILLVRSDQPYEVYVFRRDSGGVGGWGDSIFSGAATGAAFAEVAITVPKALLGYSARFGVKNTGPAPASVELRVQLLG